MRFLRAGYSAFLEQIALADRGNMTGFDTQQNCFYCVFASFHLDGFDVWSFWGEQSEPE